MLQFTEDELEQMPLVEGAIEMTSRIDPSFPATWVHLQLENLAKEAEHELMDEINPQLRLEGLLRLFYHQWGFCGDHQQYFSSDNVYLDKVLERRKGIPVTLGSLFIYLAQRLDLPVVGVGFPTQFVMKVTWYDGEILFINPFDGEYVSRHILSSWLIGHRGPFTQLDPEFLETTTHQETLYRWLTVFKSAFLREEQFMTALACSDLALLINPEDPHEIRDRGYIYQQLDCCHAAAEDYSYFIEQCPEDPAADLLKLQVQALNAEPLTLH
ncbi:TPA: SirB1 family protein [Photobacterium damselae]